MVEEVRPFISFVLNLLFNFCCQLSPGDQICSQTKQCKRNKSSSSKIAQVPHPSPNDPVCVRLHPRPPPSLLWLRLPKNHAKGDSFKESAVITINPFQILIANAAVFFILFSNFYFFAYIKKNSAPKEKVTSKEKSLWDIRQNIEYSAFVFWLLILFVIPSEQKA